MSTATVTREEERAAAWREYLATTQAQKAADKTSARREQYDEVELEAWNRLQARIEEIDS